MTKPNLPVLMVVSIYQEDTHRVIAEYLVKITVPMEPKSFAEYAITRARAIDAAIREERGQPMIPNDCNVSAIPLEWINNVYEMWSI